MRLSWQTRLASGAGAVLLLYFLWPLLGLRAHLLLGAFVGGPLLILGWHLFSRSSSVVVRRGKRANRKEGVASAWDIFRYGSNWAARRKARVVRPSLRALTRRGRLRLPVSHFATKICRVGWQTVWAPVEDAILVCGAPRSGKTGYVAARIIDAPGAVISTSTRIDLHQATSLLRGKDERPIYIYNPAGLGGKAMRSTLAYNPLAGCQDPRRAAETAADMIPESHGEAAKWDDLARRTLATLLHAAAVGGLAITVLTDWVSDPGNDDIQSEIMNALRRSPDPAHLDQAKQFLGTNPNTRSSITSSIMPALSWLASPEAVSALSGGVALDVERIIDDRATIYLLGRHETHTAALLGALTGRIVRDGRMLASQRGGRLDPPLMLALDEASRVAPFDVPEVSGDCGGAGITLLTVVQSRADIIDRWGRSGASKLVTNSAVRILFGGLADADELDAWSKLAGERDDKSHNHDSHGKRTGHGTRRVAALPVTTLQHPGERKAVVFHRNMPPVIGRIRLAWRRNDVRESILWRILIGPVSRWRENAAPQVGGWAPVIPPTSPAVLPASPVPLPRPPSDVPVVETAGGEA